MGPVADDTDLAQLLPGKSTADRVLDEEEKPTESGGKKTEGPTEPSMAPTRLIPVPAPPTNSAQREPPPALETSGNTSVSFNG